MDFTIKDMRLVDIDEYAELFADTFNSKPWNDNWTKDVAKQRLEFQMTTRSFVGKALYDNGVLMGIILGQKEPYYDGMHFQIQEFCVKNTEQHKGYGKTLLDTLQKELAAIGVVSITLLTLRGERTEGYYQKRGYSTSKDMIIMSISI